MILIIETIIIGLIEGITEWLPISSTGHMILANEFIKLNVTENFWKMFEVVIQLGAIMAVVVLFFKDLVPYNKSETDTKNTFNLWLKIIIGCIPCAIIGYIFEKLELDSLLYKSTIVAAMLIIYGILFIVVENVRKNKKSRVDNINDLTYLDALWIGLFQVLSIIPGTSRSGATILGGLLIGLERKVAANFTFYLAIPVMFGASFLKIYKYGLNFNSSEIMVLIVGMVTAFLVSIFAIKYLLKYIKNNDFKVFGIYRIILGIIVLVYFLFLK